MWLKYIDPICRFLVATNARLGTPKSRTRRGGYRTVRGVGSCQALWTWIVILETSFPSFLIKSNGNIMLWKRFLSSWQVWAAEVAWKWRFASLPSPCSVNHVIRPSYTEHHPRFRRKVPDLSLNAEQKGVGKAFGNWWNVAAAISRDQHIIIIWQF